MTQVTDRCLADCAVKDEINQSCKSKGFTGRFQGFTEEQIARSVIRDGQRVAVFFVAQQEFAHVVGAPRLVGLLPSDKDVP